MRAIAASNLCVKGNPEGGNHHATDHESKIESERSIVERGIVGGKFLRWSGCSRLYLSRPAVRQALACRSRATN